MRDHGRQRAVLDRSPAVLALAALVGFVTSLDNTIVGAAVPTIGRDLALPLADLQFVGIAYMVPFAALLLPAGRIVDRGRRGRILAVALVVFGAGAVLGGLAGSGPVLVAARVVQGIGAAFLVPGLLSLLRAGLEPRRRAVGVTLWIVCGGIAQAIGPTAGGWLSETAGWRWVFTVNVPFVLLMLALLPWASRASAPALSASPTGPAAPTRNPVLWTAVALQALWGLAVPGIVYFTPLVHQNWLGLGPLLAGLPLAFVALTVAVASPAVPAAVARFGARRVVAAGFGVVAAGMLAIGAVIPLGGLPARAPGLLLLGIGAALFLPLVATALDTVEPERSGRAGALLMMAAELSGAVGIAVTSTILLGVGRVAESAGTPPAAALATGYAVALLFAAAALGAGAAVALTRFRPPIPDLRPAAPDGPDRAVPADRTIAVSTAGRTRPADSPL